MGWTLVVVVGVLLSVRGVPTCPPTEVALTVGVDSVSVRHGTMRFCKGASEAMTGRKMTERIMIKLATNIFAGV